MGLQYVKIYAVDSKGRTVPGFNTSINVTVTGEATLLALDNGDHTTNELFNLGHIKMYNGFALAILRSGIKDGKVVIRLRLKA